MRQINATPPIFFCLLLLQQILNEANAGLLDCAAWGTVVAPASLYILPNNHVLVTYVDGGRDMEAAFKVSNTSAHCG